jgi:murein DD-endopeptidase MepM/ murein hydrolase activator NlpD
MGRVVEYALDDGRHTRTLHMSQVWVGVGQRVSRGQVLGLSGASGYGDDWYYGPARASDAVAGAAWRRTRSTSPSTSAPAPWHPRSGWSARTRRTGRTDPSTANPAAQVLDPGTVANMDAWINGENVSGNPVWFRGR